MFTTTITGPSAEPVKSILHIEPPLIYGWFYYYHSYPTLVTKWSSFQSLTEILYDFPIQATQQHKQISFIHLFI
jgi:hypothetical protein